MKGWRTNYHANGPQKKAGVAILISGTLKCIPKTVERFNHSNGPQKKAGVAILISDKLKFISMTV